MRKDARYVHVLRRTIIKNAPMRPLDSAFTSDTWCIIRMGPLYRYIHVPCVYVISCIIMEGTGDPKFRSLPTLQVRCSRNARSFSFTQRKGMWSPSLVAHRCFVIHAIDVISRLQKDARYCYPTNSQMDAKLTYAK